MGASDGSLRVVMICVGKQSSRRSQRQGWQEETMNFKAGDAVVHRVRGAGVVLGVEERQWRGSSEMYYRIQLLNSPKSRLMIPASAAEEIGLRHPIPQSKLKQVWRVLLADPGMLPTDHKERYALLAAKLSARDVLRVAEVVRDMAWRQRDKGRLTMRGKQMYENGMMRLAGEIAVVQDIELIDAETEIREKLDSSFSPGTALDTS
jgi:CarD family transcriptional regulator